MKKALKFWSGDTQFTDQAQAWPAMTIAAYSQRDAAQLYAEVGGGKHGALTHIREFMGNAGGDHFHKHVPEPQRGVYFYDDGMGFKNRHRRKSAGSASVMFVPPKSRSILEDVPEDAKHAAAQQPVPEDYGHLRVGFDRGVKVDTWTYHSPHDDHGLADRLQAEVRMVKVRREGRSGRAMTHGNGIEFVATSKCFEQISHSDIETLFERVQQAFQTYELGQRGVVWEDWLQIEVHREHVYREEHGAGFTVKYEIIKRGVDPRNGRALTINNNNVVTDFPKPKAPGKPKKRDEDDAWNFGDEQQVAFLPATPENIAALDKIIEAINSARAKLEHLLMQEKVANTLASIPSVPLLTKDA